MEELIYGMLEKSLVGGAFLYLLFYVVNKNGSAMQLIAENMAKISETLLRIDMRVEQMDERIKELEDK